jgi:hypothetical protein
MDPRRLRIYSSHLDDVRERLNDSRARQVNIKAALEDPETDY